MSVGATREYVASLSAVHSIRQLVIVSYMSKRRQQHMESMHATGGVGRVRLPRCMRTILSSGPTAPFESRVACRQRKRNGDRTCDEGVVVVDRPELLEGILIHFHLNSRSVAGVDTDNVALPAGAMYPYRRVN